jgi:tRNA(Leu) C34 or U34 (ribose-2'-O)-methylase TrmL
MTTTSTTKILSRERARNAGVAPSVLLINPKYAANVGKSLRLCSCYGIRQLWYTGDRSHPEGARLPREERMKGYRDVALIRYDYPFDCFGPDVVPVAVEVRENAERLHEFDHPPRALYVFGPEDGSIPQVALKHCHRFVVIPSRHCLNLATAVATVLWDRESKRLRAGGALDVVTPGEWERRGLAEADDE